MSAPPSSKAAQSIAAFQDGAYLARVRKLQAGTSTAKTGHRHFRDCTLTRHPRDTSKSTRLIQLGLGQPQAYFVRPALQRLPSVELKQLHCRILILGAVMERRTFLTLAGSAAPGLQLISKAHTANKIIGSDDCILGPSDQPPRKYEKIQRYDNGR